MNRSFWRTKTKTGFQECRPRPSPPRRTADGSPPRAAGVSSGAVVEAGRDRRYRRAAAGASSVDRPQCAPERRGARRHCAGGQTKGDLLNVFILLLVRCDFCRRRHDLLLLRRRRRQHHHYLHHVLTSLHPRVHVCAVFERVAELDSYTGGSRRFLPHAPWRRSAHWQWRPSSCDWQYRRPSSFLHVAYRYRNRRDKTRRWRWRVLRVAYVAGAARDAV